MKSLLVHMDGTPRCMTRLDIAAELARRHDSHLTALFATTPPLLQLPAVNLANTLPAELLQDLYLGWREKARATFQSVNAGADAVWAELGAVPPTAGFASQALFADLMVLGQHDPDEPEPEVPADFVSAVLIDSGRPALVVPYVGRFDTIGTRALVAWKPSPQSARALSAALPLLRRSREVVVAQWGCASGSEQGSALDIEGYLGLHGVHVRMQRYTEEPADVGDLVLSAAADLEADLLVMGCYGHSRSREFVLGGATRTVLSHMTLPVLMSH